MHSCRVQHADRTCDSNVRATAASLAENIPSVSTTRPRNYDTATLHQSQLTASSKWGPSVETAAKTARSRNGLPVEKTVVQAQVPLANLWSGEQ